MVWIYIQKYSSSQTFHEPWLILWYSRWSSLSGRPHDVLWGYIEIHIVLELFREIHIALVSQLPRYSYFQFLPSIRYPFSDIQTWYYIYCIYLQQVLYLNLILLHGVSDRSVPRWHVIRNVARESDQIIPYYLLIRSQQAQWYPLVWCISEK